MKIKRLKKYIVAFFFCDKKSTVSELGDMSGNNSIFTPSLYSWAIIFSELFQKGELLGQKAALNLLYIDTRPNSQKLFPSI